MNKMLVIWVAGVGLFLGGGAQAATTYTANQSGDWNTSATWSPSGPPVAGDTVNIYTNYTVCLTNGGPVANIKQINLGGSLAQGAGTLVLSNAVTLSTTNVVYLGPNGSGANGTLLIANGATFTATNLGGTGSACMRILGNGASPGLGSLFMVNNATGTLGSSLYFGEGSAYSSGSRFVVTNGGQAQSGNVYMYGTNNQVYVGGTNGSGTASLATFALFQCGASFSNSIIVEQGGTLNLAGGSDISGKASCLIVTNGGKVVFTSSGDDALARGSYNTGTYFRVTGVSAGGVRSTMDGGNGRLCICHNVSLSTNSVGNYVLVDNGGVFTNLANLLIGSGGFSLNSNSLTVASGGLLEWNGNPTFTIGHAQTFGNVVKVQGGGLQFLTANPTAITINNPNSDPALGNAVIITNGTLSFRGITNAPLPNLTNNLATTGTGIGTNNIYWQGQNTFRLDSCYATNTLAGGYTFANTGNPWDYVGLEMVNGASAIRGQAVTIGSGGSLLVSNIPSGAAMFQGALTNNSANVNLASVNSLVVSNGIVWLNNSAATTTAGTVTFDAYTTNQLAGTVTWHQAATATQVVNGVVMGAGALQKTGPGVLVLAGASSYAGGTLVSNGTLNVSGSLTSAVTVASGGYLTGAGTVVGTVTNSGYITTTITNSTGACSKLNVNGNLVLQNAQVYLVNPGNLTGSASTYTIAQTTGGTISGTFSGFNLPGGWQIKNNGTMLQLVPGFPGTMFLIQ